MSSQIIFDEFIELFTSSFDIKLSPESVCIFEKYICLVSKLLYPTVVLVNDGDMKSPYRVPNPDDHKENVALYELLKYTFEDKFYTRLYTTRFKRLETVFGGEQTVKYLMNIYSGSIKDFQAESIAFVMTHITEYVLCCANDIAKNRGDPVVSEDDIADAINEISVCKFELA